MPAWVKSLNAGLTHPLITIAGTPVSMATILVVVGILVATWHLSRVAQRATHRGLTRYGVDDLGTIGTSQRLVHYLVIALGIGVALQTAGVDLSALFAAGAVFAVGFGFAMQNVVQNFVSGLILLVERSIRPNDILDVNGEVVRVLDLGIRATRTRTKDGDDLLLPNTHLVQNPVRNLTSGMPYHRVRVDVGVAYDSDVVKVHKRLVAIATAHAAPDSPPVNVRLAEFGSSSIDFHIFSWVSNPWTEDDTRSAIRFDVERAFADSGIVIAFPQLDVHLGDTPRAKNYMHALYEG